MGKCYLPCSRRTAWKFQLPRIFQCLQSEPVFCPVDKLQQNSHQCWSSGVNLQSHSDSPSRGGGDSEAENTEIYQEGREAKLRAERQSHVSEYSAGSTSQHAWAVVLE